MRRAEQKLADILKENNLTIAFAESMSCGFLSHKLNTIKGTSEILIGSIVCYNEKVKMNLFNISEAILKKHTAESQKVTDLLAMNLRRLIQADIHAAITGLSAPGGSETKSKPVGTVFISFVYKKKIYRKKIKFNGSPLEIKTKASEYFLSFIHRILKSIAKPKIKAV